MTAYEIPPDPRRDIRRNERLPDDPERERASWGEGPWQTEPDLVEWRHRFFPGLPLLAVRGAVGAWCGYVGVPPGHPLHGKPFGDVDSVSPHGGLTYSDKCQGDICHVPGLGEPDDVWWLGFDCVHANDYAPGFRAPKLAKMTTYRRLDYVMDEVEGLAKELVELKTP